MSTLPKETGSQEIKKLDSYAWLLAVAKHALASFLAYKFYFFTYIFDLDTIPPQE